MTTEEFIKKAIEIYGDKYDYSETEYTGCFNKIKIICKNHGIFEQVSSYHLRNRKNCSKCSNNVNNLQDFITKANKAHDFKYDYSKSIFTNYSRKILIICKEHGDFFQRANDHLAGANCLKCVQKNRRKTTEWFIDEANRIHKGIYNYDDTNYITSEIKVKIKCKNNHTFKQFPGDHLSGKGCAKCSTNISKVEIEWLNYLSVPELYRQTSIYINKKQYKVDAFDPITKTVYEFYGDFWHGNLKFHKPTDLNNKNKITFGELYQNTLDRENIIKLANYNVISIWENDWIKLKNK